MKRKMLMMMAAFGASVLTFMATATSASACYWSLYQPKEPKALQK